MAVSGNSEIVFRLFTSRQSPLSILESGDATPVRFFDSQCSLRAGRGVECCTRCREDFEQECHELLNCDVLDPLTFAKLWVWAVRNANQIS